MEDLRKYVRIFMKNGKLKLCVLRPMHDDTIYTLPEKPGSKMCGWSEIPDIILEQIYGYLSYKDRYRCSMVCYNWYTAFFSPSIWRRLTYDDTTFTDRRYNLLGSERTLNQDRVKRYLGKVGRHVKYITVPATLNFHDVYNFLEVVVAYLQFFEEYPMPQLHSLDFGFACESRIPVVGPVILGTGGRFLEMIVQVLKNLKNIKRIVLNNLLLESTAAPIVLEKVVDNGHQTLTSLELLNFTKARCPLFQVAMLHSLRKLAITPAQLTDDVMVMLAKGTRLQQLVLIQDKYTPETEPVSSLTWRQVQQMNPQLRVHLEVRGSVRTEILLQEKAPVSCIIESTPYSTMSTPAAFRITENYKRTLKQFGQLTIPRKHGSRSFHNRGDSGFVLLVRECIGLQTLIIHERISTATLLLLAYEGCMKCLRELYVRKNAILLRSDWPKPPSWDTERYKWMKKVSRSYQMVEDEISALLGQKWHMLSDAEFKQLFLE